MSVHRRAAAVVDRTAALGMDFLAIPFPLMASMITDFTTAISSAVIFMALRMMPIGMATAATGPDTTSRAGVDLAVTTISATGRPVSGIYRPASAATIMGRATTAFGAAEDLDLGRLGQRLEQFERLRHRA
jgi:hypothetical protein